MFVINTLPLWGDYGRLLIAGMTGYLDRSNGRLQLLRTGPFVPPLCISGMADLIATPAMCDRLQSAAGVRGFTPIEKVKVVRLDWHTWNLTQENPPAALWGEPERPLIDGTDDQELRQAIGDMFEVLLDEDGDIEHRSGPDGTDVYRFRSPPLKNFDLFRARTLGGDGMVVCTSNFAEGLPADVARWLELVALTI